MAVERPLMKCPHCGKLNWACIEYSATGAFQIQCQTCRSAGPIGDSRDNAMELWNWREPQESPSLETGTALDSFDGPFGTVRGGLCAKCQATSHVLTQKGGLCPACAALNR